MWDLISVGSSEYVGRKKIYKYIYYIFIIYYMYILYIYIYYIYIYIFFFWLFMLHFSEMLIFRTAEAVPHLSIHWNGNYTALWCWEERENSGRKMLGWQLWCDLRGAFQALQPKQLIRIRWCAEIVHMLSSSIVRCTACEIPSRWCFLSEWPS